MYTERINIYSIINVYADLCRLIENYILPCTSLCKGTVHLNLFRQTVVEKSDWMSCGQNGSVLPQMTFLKQMSETSQTKEFEGRKIE